MNRICTFIATAASAAVLAAGLPAGGASAEGVKDRLVGAWELVSLVAHKGEKKFDLFGPNPIGRMMFDTKGRFATVAMRSGLPQFASGNRMKGTAEEHAAVVRGSNAFFGTYTVNEADKTIAFRVEFSTYPNWNGGVQKRTFTLSGDELRYVNPNTTMGATKVLAVWKRAK